MRLGCGQQRYDLGVDSQILAVQERQTLLCREAAADLFLGHEAPPDQYLTEALAALHAGGKSLFELALLDEAAAVQDGAERQAAQVISTGLLARREGFGRRGVAVASGTATETRRRPAPSGAGEIWTRCAVIGSGAGEDVPTGAGWDESCRLRELNKAMFPLPHDRRDIWDSTLALDEGSWCIGRAARPSDP